MTGIHHVEVEALIARIEQKQAMELQALAHGFLDSTVRGRAE